MTPVINPWIFYLMNVIDNLNITASITFTITMIVVFILAIFIIVGYFCEGLDNELFQFAKRRLVKPLSIFMITNFLVLTLIPNSQTITKMLIAQHVTYERVEVATDIVQEVYEDIISLFDEEN